MHALSKSQGYSFQKEKKNPKIHIETQEILNNEKNSEKEQKRRPCIS